MMPATPTTPRRTSKHRRSEPVTTALLEAATLKERGASDLSSVQDRIRQWQEQDPIPGSPPPPAEAPPSDIENGDVQGSQDIKTADRTSKTPKKGANGLADPLNKESKRRPRSNSTPRKRVVSDEHWKHKTANKTKPTSRVPQSPTDKQPDQRQSLPSTDEKAPRSRRTTGNDRRERTGNFLSAYRENDQTKRAKSSNVLPTTKIYCDENTEASVAGASGVNDDSFDGSRLRKAPEPSSCVERKQTPDTPDEARPWRSHYTETLGRPVAGEEGSIDRRTTSIRSRKAGIIGQAKELFSRNPPLQSTSNRIPSIEAWLADQPDPFVDNTLPTVETPSRSRSRLEKAKGGDHQGSPEESHKSQDKDESWGSRRDQGADKQPKSHRTSNVREQTDLQDIKASTPIDSHVQSSQMSTNEKPALREESPLGLRRRGAKSARKRLNSLPAIPDPPLTNASLDVMDDTASSPFRPQSRDQAANSPKLSRWDEHTADAHRLSTILSVEAIDARRTSLHSRARSEVDVSALKVDQPAENTSSRELPTSGAPIRGLTGSIRSVRSSRSLKSRMGNASLTEILESLQRDESRYMRELVTLVDGVIPVLLQCVLSKSDTAAAAGLFGSSSGSEDSDLTQPIVDMGVALERLKTLHKRLPTHDLNAFLSWAQTARRVYLEYLAAWRLGFQNVIVNLAPLNEHTPDEMNDGLSRDSNGDVVNSEGQKVDVAYLLKRPLVRVKNIAKMMKRLAEIKPSARSANVADEFAELLKVARQRSDEEQSRLQDEEAASMDTTKTRDLATLAALAGVKIEKFKQVKAAKDHFNLALCHSTGQRLDCLVELILRDNGGDSSVQGDLLICEVDKKERWLLFPPLDLSTVSARQGEHECEVVVYIRGATSELVVLQSDDVRAATEWVQMLGTSPAPPPLNRSLSFIGRPGEESISVGNGAVFGERPLPNLPSQDTQDIHIPIGESSVIGTKISKRELPVAQEKTLSVQWAASSVISPPPSQSPIASQKEGRKIRPALPKPPNRGQSTFSPQEQTTETPKPALRRTRGINRKPYENSERVHSSPLVSTSAASPVPSTPITGTRKLSRTDTASHEWMSSPTIDPPKSDIKGRIPRKNVPTNSDIQSTYPHVEREKAPETLKSPAIDSRIRSNDEEKKPSIREKWTALTGGGKKSKERASTGQASFSEYTIEPSNSQREDSASEDSPTRPNHHSESPSSLPGVVSKEVSDARQHVPLALRKAEAALKKAEAKDRPSSAPKRDTGRRSSSPLKREYAPSGSDTSDPDDESITSSASEASFDGGHHQTVEQTRQDTLKAPALDRGTAPPAVSSAATSTLAPSNSASQGPYRQVPPIVSNPDTETHKTIATVSHWGDKGQWVWLTGKECSISVSPGLVEVYKMSAAHSNAGTGGEASGGPDEEGERDEFGVRPLVAFELTPLVALHQGTGLDVNVRSPPTPRSIFQGHTTILFRSRSPQECQKLYHLMNRARMTNPTWEALSRARPDHGPELTFGMGPGSARHSKAGSKGGSFFKLGRRRSYRAPAAFRGKSASVAGASETSAGSISSAISALRRLSGGSMFNLNRSSVIRTEGRPGPTGPASLYTSSSGFTGTGTGGSGSGVTSPAPSQLALNTSAHHRGSAAPPGAMVNNVKVQLYVRALPDWIKKGSGLLSILPAAMPVITQPVISSAENVANLINGDPSPPSTANSSQPRPALLPGPSREPRLASSYNTPHRVHRDGSEKRVLVAAKTGGEIMLDLTLHENCIERAGRRGIALKFWEENVEISKTGGVVQGKITTYLMQLNSEAEATWVFNQVGRHRY